MKSAPKIESLELIREFLPKYLTPRQQEDLFKVISENFPKGDDASLVYYDLSDNNFFYQGDGVIDIPFASFKKGEYVTNYFNGVIMSNTCDITEENKRLESSFAQFSCIFKLEDYINELNKREVSEKRIASFLLNLRNNRISNLFYLPQKKIGQKIILHESFARFDINTTFPLSVFKVNYDKKYISQDGDRLFSFSNYGFYLFLVKISIHYCRFREGVFRSA